METNEQTPAGVEDITPSEDTATDIAQPEETGEVSTTEPAEAGEAEVTLLAGKYKTVEELEKAYGEIQKTTGQLSQKAELANLLEKQTGMNAQQIAAYIKQQEEAQLQQQIAEDPVGYVDQRVLNLERKLALKEEQAELDNFLKENPEYEPFKDKILNLGLNLERDKSYADIANEYFGQARAQGQQDAYKKIETKTNTQATGASQAAPKPRLTPGDLDSLPLSEQIKVMETIYPHADTSQRPY